jgi:hypothetical protein
MLTAHPTPPLLCIGANAHAGLGDVITDVTTILSKAQNYLPLILDVVSDPALPVVAKKIRTIQGLAAKPAPAAAPAPVTPGQAPAPPAPPKRVGIGLHRFVPAMDAAIWYLRHPWAPWAIGGATVLVLAGGGFAFGRWSGKRAARKVSAAGFGARPRRYRVALG